MKQVGDTVEADETILEIATDKVDSEVPSPVSGTIAEILYKEDETVEIGKVIAIIATEGEVAEPVPSPSVVEKKEDPNGQEAPVLAKEASAEKRPAKEPVAVEAAVSTMEKPANPTRFYSPLVKNMAKEENISLAELEQVPGTGQKGRVTKKDMLAYIKNRKAVPEAKPQESTKAPATSPATIASTSVNGNVEIIEMDRMRRLIADHMVQSKHTSPHVTSFVEVDVTNIVNWRNKVKQSFQQKHAEKITFTPIFIEAVVRAINDFPMINITVDGTNIIRKKYINIGMATALPSGNLIVPVIKNADHLNLLGLTKAVNDLSSRARANQLKPDEIKDGTFTLTNVGTFGNVMGTPIINQPQVAILAVGAIRKKPAVVETEFGDLVAVRQMMFLSLSYDHRVVDGFLGGSFLRRVGDYLEAFDPNQSI